MALRRSFLALFCTFDLLIFVLFILACRTVTQSSFKTVVPIAEVSYQRDTANQGDSYPLLDNGSMPLVEIQNSSSEDTDHSPSNISGDAEIIDRSDYRPCHWKIKECKRKLPQAIVIGVKKCGTGTLRYFMKVHPQVAFSPDEEIHYFNIPSRHEKGIQWYRSHMSLSRPNQVTMEKTPRYFVSSVAPRGIRDEVSPDTKIIVLLRSPVKRAVSDYLAVRKTEGLTVPHTVNGSAQSPPYTDPVYDIKTSFEKSVIDNGEIKVWNGLINIGIYVNHLRRWLDVFPRDQILVLDSDVLTHDPLHSLGEVEKFLHLSPFFRQEHFHFSKRKGFYCLHISDRISCQGSSKGRKHPTVEPSVLDKLIEFYKPYDKELVKLLNQNFSWIS